MSTRRGTCVAVAALVLIAACGGDDDDTTTTEAPATSTTSASTDTSPETSEVTTTAPVESTVPPTTDPSDTTTTQPSTTVEPPATDAPTTTVATEVDVRVYFARGERLAIAERTVTGPAVLGAALEALLAGPTGDEQVDGLITAVPDGVELLGVDLDDGVATVDLSSTFESGGGSLSMQARLGQLVFTATQFDNVDAVQLWLDGAPLDFLGGEGLTVSAPLGRVDVPRELTIGILVVEPIPDATVTSPFAVTGEGEVFEGDFPMWVRRDGVELTDVLIVPAGAFGTWADFSVVVTVDAPPGPIELVALDDTGCSPPECPGPVEIVVPLTLAD